jgi:lipid II:glycine glycyltransferase (peptidoglycan interpeptide bridge formation enzyme)
MYVPKGPALDYGDLALRRTVLELLVDHGRKRNAMFLKIDPEMVSGTGVPGTPEAAADAMGTGFQKELQGYGWRFSGEQIQFRNTVQLDLTQDEDALLATMKQKTRYNVRLAGRKGIRVRKGTRSDLSLLFQMYAETAARDKFIIRPLAYYHDAWGAFMESGLACPLIAEYEGEAIAAVILFCFGERVWYMYGASRDVHREKMPNHRLQWEAIRWARTKGYRVYDLWGAPDKFVESDPLWGVWRFKAGLGGQVVRHIGAWDMAISRPWYWLYTFAVPRYLALWRSWRGLRRSLRSPVPLWA